MDEDVCGLDYFGTDDSKESGIVSFLKKAGPEILADASEALKGQTTPKLDDKKGGKGGKPSPGGSGDSWFSQPALGPIPGGGVLALGLALAGALGFGVYKLAH
jgi:hypothetical protein